MGRSVGDRPSQAKGNFTAVHFLGVDNYNVRSILFCTVKMKCEWPRIKEANERWLSS